MLAEMFSVERGWVCALINIIEYIRYLSSNEYKDTCNFSPYCAWVYSVGSVRVKPLFVKLDRNPPIKAKHFCFLRGPQQ